MPRMYLSEMPDGPEPSEESVKRAIARERLEQAAKVVTLTEGERVMVEEVAVRDADGGLLIHSPTFEWEVRARETYLEQIAALGLDPDQQAAVVHASLEWWRRRCTGKPSPADAALRQPLTPWPACDRGRRWVSSDGGPGTRRTLASYMREVSGQGTTSCTRSWACCSWCQHGIGMVQAARTIATAAPKWLVTFTMGNASPLELRDAVMAGLDQFSTVNPKLGLSGALLAPSFRSQRNALHGRLHMHALLVTPPGFFPLVQLQHYLGSAGLKMSFDAERRWDGSGIRAEVRQTPQDIGRALAYVIEQTAANAYPETATFAALTPWAHSPYRASRMSRASRLELEATNDAARVRQERRARGSSHKNG